MAAHIHIGTSGWSYDHWEGVLYRPKLPVRERLAVYVAHFETVELNASYYRWPPDRNFTSWHNRLPQGFLLSVKAPQILTHFKRLNDPDAWLERILPALRLLEEKLGVFLVQLSPNFAQDLPRLDYFLEQLPSWLRTAVEFRHPSWHNEAVFDLLARHRTAYCVMSGAGLPCILRATAPFVYVRLHGPSPHHLYGGSYSDQDMRWWADRIGEWTQQSRDVFAYFNNDGFGNAVRNAQTLRSFTEAA